MVNFDDEVSLSEEARPEIVIVSGPSPSTLQNDVLQGC